MSDADVQRDLGRLEGTVDAMDLRLLAIEHKVDMLVEFASNAKGGWRMLAAVGAIGAAVGSFLAWWKP